MDKINEIFKNNTHLLNEPEVKELITYCENTYRRLRDSYSKLEDFEFKVSHLCFTSEVFLKNGVSSKKTVKEILKLLNNNV